MTTINTNITITVANAFVAKMRSPISQEILTAFGETMDEALQNLQLKLWKDANEYGIDIERHGDIEFLGYTDRDFFARGCETRKDERADGSAVDLDREVEGR